MPRKHILGPWFVPLKRLMAIAAILAIILGTVLFAHSDLAAGNREYWERYGKVVWDLPTTERLIALTFDDGPTPEITGPILEILKRYNVHATFFAVGEKVEKYPELARQIVDEGNDIGSHSYRHENFMGDTVDEIVAELTMADSAIARVTGQFPVFFRPPYGYYNLDVVNSARKLGHRVIMWSWNCDSRDWRRPGVKSIVGRVLKNPRPGDIVIMHDGGGDRSQTVKALPQIIEELQERGFRLVTLSELLRVHMGEISGTTP